MVEIAWYQNLRALIETKTDRGSIVKLLKDILQKDKTLDTQANRAIIKSVELSLVPSKAKPGSVEALIDDLVDSTVDFDTVSMTSDDRFLRVAKRGFEAVPALINHLDDDRLTRSKRELQPPSSFADTIPENLRVADLAGYLLDGLAGEKFERGKDHRVPKADAGKWWDAARKVGEEAYTLKRVFTDANENNFASDYYPLQLCIIKTKYSNHLPDLYRTALTKRPTYICNDVTLAIIESNLPNDEKLKLLGLGAEHENNRHRLIALWQYEGT